MNKNIIFYHMLCVNDAHFRFERTYKKIKLSGLLNVCDKIILVLVGKYRNEYKELISDLIADSKINYVFSDIETSEVYTINLMYESAVKLMAKREDYNFLYLHSKGITRPHLTPEMIGWMDYMEYFLIEEYDRCLKILEKEYSCGVCYRDGLRIYGGNFWWAKTSLIRTLKPLPTTTWRFDCEHWLLYNNIPEFSLNNKFDWCWGFYNNVCKRENYSNKEPIVDDYTITPYLNDSKINIGYALFGGIDCKEKIKKCIVNNKLYLRSDITLIDNLPMDDKNRFLNIEINGEKKTLRNEEYLIYGY